MNLTDVELVSVRTELIELCQKYNIQKFVEKAHVLIETYSTDVVKLDTLQLMHFSVWFKLTDIWHRLLNLGCSPFFCDFNGDSVLHYAARSINIEFLIHISNVCGDEALNVMNIRLCNLLITACAEAPDDNPLELLYMLEWLYFRGFSLESQDNTGKTPLHWAVYRNSMPIVQWLISRKAHIGHRDHMNRTVLHIGAASNAIESCLFLCQKGAFNLLYAGSCDGDKPMLPLNIAIHKRNYSLALAMKFWMLSKRLTGKISPVQTSYGLFVLVFIIFNFFLIGFMISELQVFDQSTKTNRLSIEFLVLSILILMLYLHTSKSDPGAVIAQKYILVSQIVSANLTVELDNYSKHVNYLSKYMNEQLKQLMQLELQSKKICAEIAKLNKLYRNSNRDHINSQFTMYFSELIDISESIVALKPFIANERCNSANKEYVQQIIANELPLYRICFICHHIISCRAKHCNECGICVNKFDHHCAWLDNCIGIKNQTSFYLLLISVLAFEHLHYVIIKHYLYSYYNLLYNTHSNNRIIAIKVLLLTLATKISIYIIFINALISFAWTIFTVYLIVRTTRSMITDVTFYENVRPGPHVLLRFGRSNMNSKCWDFRNLNLISAVYNIFWFFIQSTQSYQKNYPESLLEPFIEYNSQLTNDLTMNNNSASVFMWNLLNHGMGKEQTKYNVISNTASANI